jgi:feruloyl esterase
LSLPRCWPRRARISASESRAACRTDAANNPLLKLENTVISSVERVTRGTFNVPESADSVTRLPAFCRVVGELRPTTDSHSAFELWLPLDTWNGKFAGVGNGGWAGIISYSALGEQLRRGYATVSTNTGHVAESGFDMAKFAFGHPERLADFGWRSVHEMTEKGKAITAAHYGRPARYAYWIGCSTGGKQGLTEAQRFPSDYDGIVAVAPANNWARLMAGDLAPQRDVAIDAASVLTPAQARLIHSAVLKACDARDGVVDSLIENPAKCAFDPASVQCAGGRAGGQHVSDDAASGDGASHVCRCQRPERTCDLSRVRGGRASRPGSLVNPARPFPIPQSYYRWIVMGDSTWDWKSLDLSTPAGYAVQREAEAKYDPVLAAVNPNLRAFKAHGGKLIQLHGWDDQLISPQNSIDYYESVIAFEANAANDRAAAARGVQDFFRLFMVPGMLHCGGGPGPNVIDAEAALESWVERGVAPDSIIATQLSAGVPVRTRPLCPYPAVAQYKGSGDQPPPASRASAVIVELRSIRTL